MTRRSRVLLTRSRIACAAVVGALALAPAARAGTSSDAKAWVPALAALGDSVARSDRGSDAGAVAPVLVVVGLRVASDVAAAPDPAPSAPGAERPDETERWVPALAFMSGILGQEAEGSVSSNSTFQYAYVARQRGTVVSCSQATPPVGGCQAAVPVTLNVTRSLAEGKNSDFTTGAPPPGLHPLITSFVPGTPVLPTSGDGLMLTPWVGTSAELMTPGLQETPGRPRVFAHADATLAFSFVRNLAKEGIPDGAVIPDPLLPVTTELDIRGIGAKTAAEVQTLLLSGGIGVAFTVDAWDRRIRIKPSVEYMREEVEVTGRLTRAFRADTGLRGGVPLNTIPPSTTTSVPVVFFPSLDIEAAKTEDFHGIGPGLEIEMDAARAGPVVLTLFVGGQAYRMLGDLDVSVVGTGVIPALPPYSTEDQAVSARFDYHKHAWSYKGGVGLRFRWLPED